MSWAEVYQLIRDDDAPALATYLAEHKTMEPEYKGHTLTGVYTNAVRKGSIPILRILFLRFPPGPGLRSKIARNMLERKLPMEALGLLPPENRERGAQTVRPDLMAKYRLVVITAALSRDDFETALALIQESTDVDPGKLLPKLEQILQISSPSSVALLDTFNLLFRRGARPTDDEIKGLLSELLSRTRDEQLVALRRLFTTLYRLGYGSHLYPDEQRRGLADSWAVMKHSEHWEDTMYGLVAAAQRTSARVQAGLGAVLPRDLVRYIWRTV